MPPPQVIKEVPVEVVRTVIKEVPKETIKEVPVEVIKEVIVEAPYEVIKEVQVEVIKEVIKEVPVEVIKEVEKIVYMDKPPEEIIRYVDREVIKEGPLASVTSRRAATWCHLVVVHDEMVMSHLVVVHVSDLIASSTDHPAIPHRPAASVARSSRRGHQVRRS